MQGIFRFARHLAIIAVMVSALLPAGWMPSAHGLTICSVDSPNQKADQPKTDHGKVPGQDAHHDICPFAAAPHLAATPDLPQLALPAFHAFAASIDRGHAAAIAARFTPQSPRAPPHFA